MNLSDLAIRVALDLKDLKKGVGDAGREIEKISKSAESASNKIQGDFGKLKSAMKVGAAVGAVALAVGAAAKAMAEFTMESLKMADAIGDTAAALDLTAEQFQAMRFAAGLSGVEAEKFTSAMAKMNDMVGRALAGDTTAVNYFKEIGISIEDLKGKNPQQVFELLIDAIGGLGHAQSQAAAAAEIFGVKNLGMLTIMREGKQAFIDNTAAAKEYGAVMSNELVKSAGETVDKFEAMKTALGTNARVVFINIFKDAVDQATNAMAALNVQMAEWAKNTAKPSNLAESDQEAQLERRRKKLEQAKKELELYQENPMMLASGQGPEAGLRRMNQLYKDIAKYAKDVAELEALISAKNAKPAETEENKVLTPGEISERDKYAQGNKSALNKKDDELKKLEEDRKRLEMSDELYNATKARLLAERAKIIADANKKEQDDMDRFIQAKREGAKTEYDLYVEAVNKIQQAADEKRISQEEANRLIAIEGQKYADKVIKASEKEAEAVQKVTDARNAMIASYVEILDPYQALLDKQEEERQKLEELLKAETDLAKAEADRAAQAAAHAKQREEYKEKEAEDKKTELDKMMEEWGDIGGQIEDTMISAFEGGVDAMTDALMSGKANFKDFARSILADLTKIILKWLILRAVSSFMGGMGGAAGGTGAGGGVMPMAGGPMYAASGGVINGPTIVGERGPELVIPNNPARVLNNHATNQAMAPQSVKVEVVNRGTPQKAVNSDVRFDPKGMVVQVILEDIQKNGPIASGLTGAYGMRRKV